MQNNAKFIINKREKRRKKLKNLYLSEKYGQAHARVTAVHKNRFVLGTVYGEVGGALKSSVFYAGGAEFPTVGDIVEFEYNPLGDSRILTVLPRKSLIKRLDPSSGGKYAQLVAANVDYVFIMSSANREFNINRIQRYLAVAQGSGAKPVVILSKCDLAVDPDGFIEKIRAAGCADVVKLSVLQNKGLDEIGGYLKSGSVSCFLGSSGVGKSTLVNAIAGEKVMETSGIRCDDDKGRHTTSSRQMILLESGAMIIDTPGMREFGVWTADLGQTFVNIAELETKCRFDDCTHRCEPGCAVLEAVESGQISRTEYDNFMKIKRETLHAQRTENMRKWKKPR